MRSKLRLPVLLALITFAMLWGGSPPSYGQGATLSATLTTNRGCGASAVYNLGEFISIQYSVSQTAQVTLLLQYPNGTVRALVNQTVPGGVVQTISGIIGSPLGQRRLVLDAVSGVQTTRVECTYTTSGTTPPPGQLNATLTTNKGCGAGAVFALNEFTVFRYSVSQTALVTLRLVYPDGSSRILVNQTIPGGVQQTITGRIGLPLGQRRLILDAVAGSQTAHAECTYTTSGTTPPPGQLTATLTTNRGCGAGAVFNVGEATIFRYSVSQTAQVTLRLQRPDGTIQVLVNQTIPGGVTQTFTGQAAPPTGQRRLILDAVAGTQTAHVECTFTVGTTTPPPGQLTANLTTNRGCGATAVFNIGETTVFNYSVSQTAQVTLRLQFPDGTSRILVNQTVPGGVSQTIAGQAGLPTGQRRLTLDAVAGTQTAHVECTYTVGGTTPPPGQQTLNLSINKGCGAQYQVGEPITVTYSASFNTNLTMFIQDSNGRQSIVFTNRPVVAGQTNTLSGVVGPGATSRTIILRPTALLPAVQATCTYTIVQ